MDNDHSGNYEEGVRDGRLAALERRMETHDAHMHNHERRLLYLERIVFGMLAIVAFTSVGPEIMDFFNALSNQ